MQILGVHLVLSSFLSLGCKCSAGAIVASRVQLGVRGETSGMPTPLSYFRKATIALPQKLYAGAFAACTFAAIPEPNSRAALFKFLCGIFVLGRPLSSWQSLFLPFCLSLFLSVPPCVFTVMYSDGSLTHYDIFAVHCHRKRFCTRSRIVSSRNGEYPKIGVM